MYVHKSIIICYLLCVFFFIAKQTIEYKKNYTHYRTFQAKNQDVKCFFANNAFCGFCSQNIAA